MSSVTLTQWASRRHEEFASPRLHPVVIARRAMRERMKGDESGFTLIELIFVIVIVPIIIGAIASALIAVFSLQNSVSARLGDSNDAEVGSATFNKDVQSAVQYSLASTPPACGPSTQDQLLGLEWAYDGSVTGSYNTVVSYDVVANNATTNSLIRYQCTANPVPLPPTVSSTIYVAHDIGTPTISVTGGCQTGCPTWNSTARVQNITINVVEPNSKYSYQLVGLPGESSSGGTVSNVQPNPTPSGCNLASPSSGGGQVKTLCFADFSSVTQAQLTGATCHQMSLAIANTPDFLNLCIRETGALALPHSLPTYYSPSGGSSEAYLGNNGFYTGVPGEPAIYQTGSGITNVYVSGISVTNAQGDAATGWTLITGDAESTDTNEWEVYTQTSGDDWDILPNGGASDLWGNACYDTYDDFNSQQNNGVLQYTGPQPPSSAQQNLAGGTNPQYGQLIPSVKAGLTINNSNNYSTGVSSILCEESIQLNKTGTLMLASPEGNSTSSQSMTVTMYGNGLEAMFLGVLL